MSGLDPVATQELYGLIESINREGIAVVMVSHDIRAAVRYATHILHLAGKPLYSGPRDGYEKSAAGRRFKASKNPMVFSMRRKESCVRLKSSRISERRTDQMYR